MKKKKLVIAPHIDDEVLGCASILDINTVVLFCGVEDFHVVSKEERLNEVSRVADFFNYSYDVLETTKPNSYTEPQLIDVFEHTIKLVQPEEIYIPYPSYNQDHRTVYNAALVATRRHDRNHFIPKVFVYEEMCRLWGPQPDISVNYYIPLDLERKLEGYKLHASQQRGHRPFDIIETMAKLRGFESGFTFAEGFIVKRYIHECTR